MSGEATLENIDKRVRAVEAQALAKQSFGIYGHAEQLSGERDQNFRLTASDGCRYLLKISNSAEDPTITDLQTQALLHLERENSNLPAPRVILALDGTHQTTWRRESGTSVTVRLLSYLEGDPLHQIKPDDELLAEIGRVLARFDRALHDFSHPADQHDLLWDVQHAQRVKDWLWAIDDVEQRELAGWGLSIFEENARPKLNGLPAQVIHNDFNPHNILIDRRRERISGILDLGDAVRAPRIIDLAVAAAYHVREGANALDGVAAVVGGYDSTEQLMDEEFEVLTPLIVARLAMTIVITAWRADRHPENRDYILKNAPLARAGLQQLAAQDLTDVGDGLRSKIRRLVA